MQYELRMQPKVNPLTWKQFCKETPPYSIAVDGFVKTGPRFEQSGPRANFNHHEEVDRLATRATCGQVLVAIRQGLFDAFRNVNGAKVIVYANDCDQDVCTTHFLLKHGYMAVGTMNPALNRLVSMEEMLDTTAGAYPFPADLPILEQLAWIYEPYTRFRLSGALDNKDADQFIQVVTDVEMRIMSHISGTSGRLPLDLRYEKLGGGHGWTMVRELGAQARTQMFGDGIHAYVSVRDRLDGKSWTYTVGRMSQFVPFDLPKIFALLNYNESRKRESLGLEYRNVGSWGGAFTVGGSPRAEGSYLSPPEVEKIINGIVS